MNLLLQLIADGLVKGVLFAVLACAFGLVYRSSRIFHIAFAGLMLVAPYMAWYLTSQAGWNVWLSALIGLAGAAIAGLLLELVLYRPLMKRKATPIVAFIASLGAWIVIVNGIGLIFGYDLRTFDRALASRVEIGPVSFTTIQLWAAAVCIVLLVALGIAIHRNRHFRAVWAIGDEPELVLALGLPLLRYRMLILAGSSLLAGVVACLLMLDVGVTPHIGMSYLLVAVVAVLVGGVDSYKGWILGAIVLALLQSVVIWKLSARWIDLSTFTVLLALLFFRPQGLFGMKRRLEEAGG